ncbi:hypothetical protein TNIN_298431 [Trichonephila inaurata madagascariensis]|uniref:Uncharacterized protein n=1 Tax=Trichonephila inaurata madagascariensis TaxID=2747483 RepID=A0A8X6Y4J5_9ARAC|nr:hypothetical protein TNIN_298431 [Trichonephila inaurata madagascariensis]
MVLDATTCNSAFDPAPVTGQSNDTKDYRGYPQRSSPFPKRKTQEPSQTPPQPQNSSLPPPFLLQPAFPAMNMIKTYFNSNFVHYIPQSDFNMGTLSTVWETEKYYIQLHMSIL